MNGEEPMTFMKLPKDLIFNCLARVSRLHYQTLFLVSKRFRSLLSSKELYQTRSLLGCTETCLYVWYTTCSECWFTLCLKPNSSKKVLVLITSPNSPNRYQSTIARVGSNIYSIGRSISKDKASSRVLVMDCISHTWLEAPSMLFAREAPSACVLDGKIYVTGGCKNLDESNLMEVFDTKTQTWEFLRSGNSKKVCNGYRHEGTVCLETDMVHKLHEGSWRAGDLVSRWHSSCVIGNLLYICTCEGTIFWYDSEAKYWGKVKGLERSFGSKCEAKLADFGGKLAVLWKGDEIFNGLRVEREIWCGEIEIIKCQQGEIWGKFEWSDIVSTTNERFNGMHVLAVTL